MIPEPSALLLLSLGFAAPNGMFYQPQAFSRKIRQRDGVLRDEPGDFGAVFADDRFAEPARLVNYLFKRGGIFQMNSLHFRMITFEKFARFD